MLLPVFINSTTYATSEMHMSRHFVIRNWKGTVEIETEETEEEPYIRYETENVIASEVPTTNEEIPEIESDGEAEPEEEDCSNEGKEELIQPEVVDEAPAADDLESDETGQQEEKKAVCVPGILMYRLLRSKWVLLEFVSSKMIRETL